MLTKFQFVELIRAHFYTPFGVVRWVRYLALPLGELAAKPTERALASPYGRGGRAQRGRRG